MLVVGANRSKPRDENRFRTAVSPFMSGGGRGLKPENPLNTAAKAHGVSVFQVALAWLLERSPVMLPIPGTSSLAHLEDNVAAGKLKLTPQEWKAIDALAR